MQIFEDKIVEEYGSISAFLRKHEFSRSTYRTLQNKKTNIYHDAKSTMRLKQCLIDNGYASSQKSEEKAS